MIADLAKKLGITSDRIIKKAEEYERLSRLKTGAGSSGKSPLNGVAKMVLCIDVAASEVKADFDKVTALKLSGLKNTAYISLRGTLKQLLGLAEDLSLDKLCGLLNCREVLADSQKLLQTYFELHQNGRTDVDHPAFRVAAVASVAKTKKISIDTACVRELSSLKKSALDSLVATMATIYKQENQKRPKQSQKRPHSLVEAIEEMSKETGAERSIDKCEEPRVDFAAWKKRMLEEANLTSHP